MLIKFLVFMVATEALVELVCKAELLNRPRSWVQKQGWFFQKLVDCPYCVSVWVGISMALLWWLDNPYLSIVVYGLCLHRLSNFLHLIFSLVRDLQFNIILSRKKSGSKSSNE